MYELLDKISSPADLKGLSVSQLKALAEEIRQFILASVSKTGGHLASNLGVVEVTLALHRVFDFSKDKLLWDVGHQCYAHKILTGRKDTFGKLRQADGPSGFPNPDEGPYDQFCVGHAGTSVATAIGMALGQAHQKQKDKIVALVGDASIVNGVSFEALNNLGLVKRQLLIVLNDNSMAIDATQGAVAKYFSKVRLSQTYEDMRKTTKSILEHTPFIGKSVDETLERLKKYLRMALPASQLFESLNIPYFGPVDGHDIGSLIQLFSALKEHDHPAILHIYTKKGEGFSPAGNEPHKYHSTGPFKINGDSIEKGTSKSARKFTDSLGDYLVELAAKDEKVVAITSAMGTGTGLDLFRKKFPDRFYDVGIAESAAVDIAAGMAKAGLKPVVCIYSTFLQRSFDQIFQEVSLQNLPVIFCIDRAGLVGSDGPTHHGQMDIGYLRMMPNFVLTAPSDDTEMELALEFALKEQKPVCIRYPKDTVPQDDFDRSACRQRFELGKSVTVKKGDNPELKIVAYGTVLTQALQAEQILADEGIDIDVINARFAEPIDEAIFEDDLPIITLEDHNLACGFGSVMLETANRLGKTAQPIVIIAGPGEFIRHDTRSAQLTKAGINAATIVKNARILIGQGRAADILKGR
ncbi:MAG: 1-deoxy-D-xylulose-5-phosphate synthase [Sedimentisphaerales bacterium]|nr:1-deoxy-D-xylulose-5-phosphate synthase [Sedimentisphaerales bacterium]